MKKSAKNIRLNFRLSRSLSAQLAQRAKSKGTTKSYLLREWIKHASILTVSGTQQPSKDTVSYNFVVSRKTAKKVTKLSNEFEISKGALLRLIISNNISVSFKKLPKKANNISGNYIARLWNLGKLSEISYLLSSDIEQLNVHQLYVYARVSVILGKIEAFDDTIELLRKTVDTKTTPNMHLLIDFLLVQNYIYRRETTKAKKKLEFIEQTLSTACNPCLRGYYYLLLGLYSEICDNIDLSIYYLHKSLEYFDQTHFPFDRSIVHIYLAYIYSFNSDSNRSKIHLAKVFNIQQLLPNDFIYALMLLVEANINIEKGRFKTAQSCLTKLWSKSKALEFRRGLFYSNIELGKYNLHRGNEQLSEKYLQKAKFYEKELRNSEYGYLSSMFSQFIRSRENYCDSVAAMNELIIKSQISKMSSRNYLLYTSKYLHGPTKELRKEGENNLVTLSTEGPTNRIQEAAVLTLKNNQLYPHAAR